MENRWIRNLTINECTNYKYNLFCLPYAGGGASIFANWQRYFEDAGVRVCPILLPGRESRIGEKLIDNAQELASEIYYGIKAELNKPFVLFGHSMGGIVAYELASLIYKKENKLPEVLFISGAALFDEKPMQQFYDKSEYEFIQHLLENNGTTKELADNKIFKQYFLPVIRSDYKLAETYQYNGETLPTEICAFYSKEDREVDYREILKLEKVSNDFTSVEFTGGHFFINEVQPDVCKSICRIINDKNRRI